MKRILPSVLRLVLCGIESVGLAVCAPLAGINSVSLVRPPEVPDCLNDLSIQVTSNPSNIVYGQSSLVSWSVSLPPECGYASVQLNGQPVTPGGSRTVTPTQSTTYQVTVFIYVNGVSSEKTASTRITVTDPLTNLFCPFMSPYPTVESWETDPQVQPLIESLDLANPTILFGPNVILDFNHASDEEAPLTLNPGVTFVSICAFLPDTQDSLLKSQILERRNPAAASAAT